MLPWTKVEASQGHVGPTPPEADSKYKFGLKNSVAWPESYVPHMLWGPHRKPGPPDLPLRGYYGSQDWNLRKRAPPDSFTYLWTGFIDLPRFEAHQLCWEKGRASPLHLGALAYRYNLITCKATSNAYGTWGYHDFFSGDTEVQEAGSTYAVL